MMGVIIGWALLTSGAVFVYRHSIRYRLERRREARADAAALRSWERRRVL